jgi:ribulose-5-phosphate 4-epimerase/fuculose-1-phosphate aldolase
MEEKLVCFPEEEILKPREIIMEIMQHTIDRGLTDYSGGNMALRVGPKIYSTQTHSADKYRWRLRPDNIVVTDINKNILEGRQEKLSREFDLHIGILQRFPEINCTLHGNTFYSPLIISSGLKPSGITEVADYYKIKDIPIVPLGVEPLSEEENNIIFNFMADLKKKDEALVVIMPVHGVIVAAKNHDEAFSLLEAVENNSKFLLFRTLLSSAGLVQGIFEKMGRNMVINDAGKNTGIPAQDKNRSLSEDESVYILEPSVKILTAEDLLEITGKTTARTIRVDHNCTITDFAEMKAAEAGVRIIRKN